ncbi:protein AIR2 [Diplogelasinospora grovesii]|uniref:Protein AIR2 n=1 Tax=Diplogelasinospora grovesii TaxID=303347 RepID=A0AAN6NBL3_9PEZI|nr:protein AIR2 [Diplogelasinospora grovesii]
MADIVSSGQASQSDIISTEPQRSPRSPKGQKRTADEADIHDEVDVTVDGAELSNDTSLRHKKTKLDSSEVVSDVDESDGHDEGEVSDSSQGPKQSKPSLGTDAAAEDSHAARAGWNSGVGSGLRITFGAKGKTIPGQTRLSLSSASVEPQPNEPDAESEEKDIDGWTMPEAFNDWRRRLKHGETWQGRYEEWCESLMRLNKDREGVRDPALLQDAWCAWLQEQAYLPTSVKTKAQEASSATHSQPWKLQEIFNKASSDTRKDSKSDGDKSVPVSKYGVKISKMTLPPPLPLSEFNVISKDEAGWQSKFIQWCRALISINKHLMPAETPPSKLAKAFARWLSTIDGLSKNKFAAAKRSAMNCCSDPDGRAVQLLNGTLPEDSQPQDSNDWVSLLLNPEESPVVSPSTSTGGEEDGAGFDMAEVADAEYRDRYFPGLGPDAEFCVVCASFGHTYAECPELTCRFCHGSNHASYGCPTRRRCTRCRQLGHAADICKEKLALPQDELDCAICQSRDHLETACGELSRSFRPTTDSVRKVQCLPMYCYCCGNDGHFGPKCGLNRAKPNKSGWETWSKANYEQYLDDSSNDMPIILSMAGSFPEVQAADARINLGGKSIVPRRHIVFEDADDDDDEEFIRPPVEKKPRASGRITFSANGNNTGALRGGFSALSTGGKKPPNTQQQRHNNGNNGGRAAQYASVNPPLPPGPPPPLPPPPPQQHGYRSQSNGNRPSRRPRRGGYGGGYRGKSS